jgi:hypothetical protein
MGPNGVFGTTKRALSAPFSIWWLKSVSVPGTGLIGKETAKGA